MNEGKYSIQFVLQQCFVGLKFIRFGFVFESSLVLQLFNSS